MYISPPLFDNMPELKKKGDTKGERIRKKDE